MSCSEGASVEHECPISPSWRIATLLHDINRDFIPPLSSMVDIDEYALKLSCNAMIVYVLVDGKDAGECCIYLNRRPAAFITSIGVLGRYRGNGLGGILLDEALMLARSEGFETVSLEVDFSNESAINLYKARGFAVIESKDGWHTMRHIIGGAKNERGNL